MILTKNLSQTLLTDSHEQEQQEGRWLGHLAPGGGGFLRNHDLRGAATDPGREGDKPASGTLHFVEHTTRSSNLKTIVVVSVINCVSSVHPHTWHGISPGDPLVQLLPVEVFPPPPAGNALEGEAGASLLEARETSEHEGEGGGNGPEAEDGAAQRTRSCQDTPRVLKLTIRDCNPCRRGGYFAWSR